MKNNSINLILFMLLISVCYSCNTQSSSENENGVKISIETEEISKILISEFTTEMETIKLETKDSCLLGDISHLKLSRNYVYVKDQIFNGIYEFDKQGKFIRKLDKEGSGPGEYLLITDFIIDEERQTLEILDTRLKKIFIYSLSDLSLMNEISMNLTAVFRFVKKDDFYYFATKGHRNIVNEKPTNSEIISYNSRTKSYNPVFDKLLPDTENQSWDFNDPFTVNSENDIYFSIAGQNKCYKMDGEKVSSVITIDAGLYDIPETIKRGSYDQKVEYLNSSSIKDKYLFFKLFTFEKETFMLTCSRGGKEPHYYVSIQGKTLFSKVLQNDYISGCPEIDPNTFLASKDYLISLIIPRESPSPMQEKHQDYLQLNPEDNPAILLFRVKNNK